MRGRSLRDIIREFGYHDVDEPRNRRWGVLPNRTHLHRGVRMKGHILRIRHHRGQPEA
jgi:hypothetical protein